MKRATTHAFHVYRDRGRGIARFDKRSPDWPAIVRRPGRASDKKKPFLIRGEDKRGVFWQDIGERFEEPGADGPDDGVGEAETDEHRGKRDDETGSQFPQMFSQRLSFKLLRRGILFHNNQ